MIVNVVLGAIALAVGLWHLRLGVHVWRDDPLPAGESERRRALRRASYAVGPRMLLPVGAGMVGLAALVVVEPLLPDGGQSEAGNWIGLLLLAGFLVPMALGLVVWMFNRPRFLVAPGLRAERGSIAAWWHHRSR